MVSIRSHIPLFAAFLTAALLTSCVSTKNVALSANDRAAMRGKSLIATKRDMPAFGVITPGAMMTAGLTGPIGGAIVGGMASSEGKSQVSKHQLQVPEDTISTQLMKTLVSRTGAKALPTASNKVVKEDPKAIAALYHPADYILDVRTTGWTGIYYPMTLTKYRIIYGAKMRLIEASSGRVIAEGFNAYMPDDKEHAPTYEGIYSNNAAFLRGETKKGTDAATSVFSAQF